MNKFKKGDRVIYRDGRHGEVVQLFKGDPFCYEIRWDSAGSVIWDSLDTYWAMEDFLEPESQREEAPKTGRRKVALVRLENWEGIYVDGLLARQDHLILVPNAMKEVFNLLGIEFEMIDLAFETYEEEEAFVLPKELWKVKKLLEEG